jgi:hypothetical protein
VSVSEVYATFANKLLTAIMNFITITQAKHAYMLKLNQHRFAFVYGNAHGIGYLLDPGKGMSIELQKQDRKYYILATPAAGELSTVMRC